MKLIKDKNDLKELFSARLFQELFRLSNHIGEDFGGLQEPAKNIIEWMAHRTDKDIVDMNIDILEIVSEN